MGSMTPTSSPKAALETGTAPAAGPIRLGSEEHKRLFCRTLLTTFDPYRPAVHGLARAGRGNRATGSPRLPIWDIAVQTEGKAGLRVATYAEQSPIRCCKQADRARTASRNAVTSMCWHNLVAGLWHHAGARAGLCAAEGPGMGLHGHRLQRMHRQLFRLRPVRAGPDIPAFFRLNWSTPSSR